MKFFHVDEAVIVWSEATVEVPDEMTETEFVELLKEKGCAFALDDVKGCRYMDQEYLPDTETNLEDIPDHSIEVYNEHYDLISKY